MSDERVEKDYYQILGVPPTASSADIAAAYRHLASRCHPDVAAKDSSAPAKIKLINEAYDVLSDEKKRRQYDRQSGRRRSVPISTVSSGAGASTRAQTPSSKIVAAGDVEVELPIAPEEARYGGPCNFKLCVAQPCDRCHGGGRIGDAPCSTCQGAGKIYHRRRLQIDLPRGVTTGALIRVVGAGKPAPNSAGDLLLRIKVQPSW